jgi:hypothetical protein
MTETPVATVERISPDRKLRICDVCGGVDDHPRHVLAAGLGEIPVNEANLAKVLADDSLTAEEKAAIVADIVDTTTQLRHLDCCTTVGCPDGTCNRHSNDLKGGELLAAIQLEGPTDNNPAPADVTEA